MRLQQLETKTKKAFCYWDDFDSLTEFFQYVERHNSHRSDVSNSDQLRSLERQDSAVRTNYGIPTPTAAWGTVSFEKAKAVCLDPRNTGLPGREAKIIKITELFKTALKMPGADGQRKKIVREAFGDELDIHQVNNGAIDRAWTKRRRTKVKNIPTYCLLMQTDFNGYFDSGKYAYIGPALAYALLELGRKAGHNVSLVGYAYTHKPYDNEQRDHLWTVPVAVAGRRLLLRSFCQFTLGVFPRYFGNYVMANHPERLTWGFGKARTLDDKGAERFLLREHLERRYGKTCTINHADCYRDTTRTRLASHIKNCLNQAVASIPEQNRGHLQSQIDDNVVWDIVDIVQPRKVRRAA